MILSDTAAERAVLAGLMRFGANSYMDISDMLSANTFTIDSNQILYTCIKKVLENNTEASGVDVPSILSAAQSLKVDDFIKQKAELSHLNSIKNFPVLEENVRKFAAKIRKLEIARLMHYQLEECQKKYEDLKGDESISHILGLAEESIFNFSSLINDVDNNPTQIFSDAYEYFSELAENPVDQVGIPTGFNKYDYAIGGGLRRGTVNVIGARPKVGKSSFVDNMGYNIASRKIPVLNLDTEMRKNDHQLRIMANIADITIHDLECGKFGKRKIQKDKVLSFCKDKKNLPYYYRNISGMAFEDQLATMRRWVLKVVGLNENGKANPCVIFYDYLKLMDTAELKGDMKEFQLLGFMMTSLHNFAIKYDLPIMCFIQLNRDGVTKEGTESASGSDRIIWLCSNFTIYKNKSDEEIASDGPEFGNKKLVPVIARHGAGLEFGDYINIQAEGSKCRIRESYTAFEIKNGVPNEKRSNQNESPGEEEDIPF